MLTVEERNVAVDGLPIRYLSAGEGEPLVLLHGAGDNSLDWRWVLPALARAHRVYAPDLPGSDDSAKPAVNYSPAFFERFLGGFVDALGVERATFVGNSLGGLIALCLALSEPARVGSLVLVDGAGLGREISPVFTSVNVPGLSEAAIPLWRTPVGAYQRAWGRATLLFARPWVAPREWLAEQCRLAQSPDYPEAHLTVLRSLVSPAGQREVLLDRLPLLEMPTLVVWGERDRVFPESQGRRAAARLREGSLELIPDCGHLPHIERPRRVRGRARKVPRLRGATPSRRAGEKVRRTRRDDGATQAGRRAGSRRDGRLERDRTPDGPALRREGRQGSRLGPRRGGAGLARRKDKGGRGEATAIPAEVTDFEQVETVADRALEEYGGLDTWVHLSAVLLVAAFEETEPDEFARVVDVNLMGQVYGAMAALPHMKRNGGGALVHVSSMGAKRSIPLQSAYCASKHGVDGFLEALRVELRREGAPVSVTQVMPATINTPFFDKARTKLGVRPVAPPPIYQPGVVADAILHAAEHPARDLVVGGAARAVITGQQVSPRLLDALLERFGFEVHYTDEPKSEDDPDNLFEPVRGLDTVEGSFGDRAHPTSLYNWLELRPALKRTAGLGAALGVLAILRGRS